MWSFGPIAVLWTLSSISERCPLWWRPGVPFIMSKLSKPNQEQQAHWRSQWPVLGNCSRPTCSLTRSSETSMSQHAQVMKLVNVLPSLTHWRNQGLKCPVEPHFRTVKWLFKHITSPVMALILHDLSLSENAWHSLEASQFLCVGHCAHLVQTSPAQSRRKIHLQVAWS